MIYDHLVFVLAENNGIKISTRHLKRQDVVDFMKQEVKGPGLHHGYRIMFAKCRDIVRKESNCTFNNAGNDPEGVEIRTPKRLVRCDVFILRKDPIVFGTSIGTIIETFRSMLKQQYRWLISRRIISLNVYHTNNNPRIIGIGSPCIVRGDCGTENGHVRDIQIFFIEIAHYIETA
ncbi:hypothetical protein KUTeg_011101 [Tegillarca granosa]|uniref:Uncharacterized protein n=1 Tax=Tegillarca granosa TaxID=220873 RepID=A0ABQ9F586_TEGGR|nr:hypothetical protein KUTeg_011101 [Tegillarca granosa]